MPDIFIQGSDIVIDLVPDRGVDSAVDNAYHLLHQRLVLRLSAPCGKNGTAIVVGKVQKVRIDYRFVPVGFGDGTFKVVRHQGFGDAPEVMKGIFSGGY